MTIHFGVVSENTTLSTELPRDFCAGISPLQLGVVLVSIDFIDEKHTKTIDNTLYGYIGILSTKAVSKRMLNH